MKKLLIVLSLALVATFTQATVVGTKTAAFVKVKVTNDVSPWFQVNNDNVGVAVQWESGQCTLEAALDAVPACMDNTATPFYLDGNGTGIVNKNMFMSVTGVSCVRLSCPEGIATLFIRGH